MKKRDKSQVSLIENKMRETRLRLFDHVKEPIDATVRKRDIQRLWELQEGDKDLRKLENKNKEKNT